MAPRELTVVYRKAGTQPPVYVAGTFSDPPWQPQEMTSTVDEQGEHTFKKDISIAGDPEIQYKFRLGLGDWWATDENVETVSDNQGNVNNVVRVDVARSDDADIEEDAEPAEDACPMFSHECLGSHDVSPSSYPINAPENEPAIESSERLPSPVNANNHLNQARGEAEIDFNDPTLEHFPHNDRKSIIAAIQRIGTSIAEDRSVPEGSPPSPIVSRLSVSAGSEPQARRSNASRDTLGSMHSELSHASLGSIQESAEDCQDAAHQNGSAVVEESPASLAKQESLEPPTVRLPAPSNHDEGVSLNADDSKNKQHDTTDLSRKRSAGNIGNRPTSSASMNSIHEAHKHGHWLSSFLHVLFVDWIGGFFSNFLFGNRRKA